MRRIWKTVSLILTLALLLACTAPLTGCGKKHAHSGSLTALRTDEALGVPCCGIFFCAECGETYEASVTCKDVGLPVVRIEGDLEGISKENKKTAEVVYDGGEISFTSRATLKWQGENSLTYPKKNFSLQFTDAHGVGRKITLRDAWGQQSKYCLKANWDDYAGARNLVSAKLWGEIVHSRSKNDRLDALVNGGGVDGYPVVLYINGIFHGLYTLNTPKNRWIFDISKQDRRAGLLFAENWTDSTSLHSLIDTKAPPEVSGWDVEYCTTEDTAEGTGWLFAGMNALISFVLNSDDATFRAEIGDYTDVDRVIDYMLFVFFICGGDNLGRNIIWVTYDGKQYLPSAYDLDKTWKFDKRSSTPELTAAWYENDGVLRTNLLFSRLLENFEDEIRARCAALRKELLEYGHIEKLFSDRFGQIPEIVRAAESERWPSQKLPNGDTCAAIMRFFTERSAALDKIYGSQQE